MKKIIQLLFVLLLAQQSYAQHVYQIRADSVRIYNVCDTAELIIENRTRGVNGFLFNKGNGRTEFRRIQLESIGNSQIAITGQDTLDLSTLPGIGGVENIFRSGDSIKYVKNGSTYALYAPIITDASRIVSGIMATARLGSGTADNSRFLRGDGTWSNSLTGNFITGGTFLATNGTVQSFQGITGGISGSGGTFSNHDFEFYTNNSFRGRVNKAGRWQFGPSSTEDDGFSRILVRNRLGISGTTSDTLLKIGYATTLAAGGAANAYLFVKPSAAAITSSTPAVNITGGYTSASGLTTKLPINFESDVTGANITAGANLRGNTGYFNNLYVSDVSTPGQVLIATGTDGLAQWGSLPGTTVPDLQAVTEVGSMTNRPIVINAYDAFTPGLTIISQAWGGMGISVDNMGSGSSLIYTAVTGSRAMEVSGSGSTLFGSSAIDDGTSIINAFGDIRTEGKLLATSSQDSRFEVDPVSDYNVILKAVSVDGSYDKAMLLQPNTNGRVVIGSMVDDAPNKLQVHGNVKIYDGTYEQTSSGALIKIKGGSFGTYSNTDFHIMADGSSHFTAIADGGNTITGNTGFGKAPSTYPVDVNGTLYATQVIAGNTNGGSTPTSKLQSAGSFAGGITTISTSTTLGFDHFIVPVNNTTDITVSLPAASTCPGRIYVIKKTSNNANTVTIDPNASETIDGNASMIISEQWKLITVVSDGNNWLRISSAF